MLIHDEEKETPGFVQDAFSRICNFRNLVSREIIPLLESPGFQTAIITAQTARIFM